DQPAGRPVRPRRAGDQGGRRAGTCGLAAHARASAGDPAVTIPSLRTEEGFPPALLHNMSAMPRTIIKHACADPRGFGRGVLFEMPGQPARLTAAVLLRLNGGCGEGTPAA